MDHVEALRCVRELGRSAERGRVMLERAKTISGGLTSRMGEEAAKRSDAYDEALTVALEAIDRVRTLDGNRYADALEARYVEGMRWDDVGATLFCSNATARNWAARGLKTLAE